MKSRVANLIVAGVSKCGSTSLFSYLASHPDVCGSSVKETQFFMPLKFGKELLPISEYENYFSKCANEKFRLDATPYYLFGRKKIAEAIREVSPDAKIIFIFREPAARSFSWYQHAQYHLMAPAETSFLDFISEGEKRIRENENSWDNYTRSLQEGFYFESLQDWFNIFTNENIKIVFFENLKNNPRNVLHEICEWLNIDSALIPDSVLVPENTRGNYRFRWFRNLFLWARKNQKKLFLTSKPLNRFLKKVEQRLNKTSRKESMSDDDKKYLQNIFKTHNESLKKLLIEKGYSEFPDWLK